MGETPTSVPNTGAAAAAAVSAPAAGPALTPGPSPSPGPDPCNVDIVEGISRKYKIFF